ncbi:glycosyltransferase [Paenibacillus koleovorans]|uniref:glycosyltransferase n=1 Tax=Paenibacillus koleovorans TaxID=121608 RepID=UPI000FDA79EF|nr:glycosyltransferase [Paenibacillus koleovorans]
MTHNRIQLAVFCPEAYMDSSQGEAVHALLSKLSDQYECHLFVETANSSEQERSNGFGLPLVHHPEFLARSDAYSVILYVLSSCEPHLYMLPYMRRFPGVAVVLKLDQSGRIPGWEAALQGSKSVLVDNEDALKLLSRQGCHFVVRCPKPAKLSLMISLVVDKPFDFISYGHTLETCAYKPVFRSIRKLVDTGCAHIRYSIIGDYNTELMEQHKSLVRKLRLEDYVHFLPGSCDTPEVQRRIAFCDACLFLHKPEPGEFSDTVLTMLGHGKPTLVAAFGAYQYLPDHAVCKLNPDDQMRHRLFEAMLALYRDKEKRRLLSKQARAYVSEHHTISSFVEKIREQIEYALHGSKQRSVREEVALVSFIPNLVERPQTKLTLVLQPNRFTNLMDGGKTGAYFSFNLVEIPEHAVIERAVLHISSLTRRFRVYGIRKPWSERGASSSKPQIQSATLHKQNQSGALKLVRFTWECTGLVKRWRQAQLDNHGLFVPSVPKGRKPKLYVELHQA